MRDTMWIYTLMFFFSEAWSQNPGTNESTPVKSNTSVSVYVDRYESFNLEHDATLMCSNRTWKETMYVIWKVHLKNKQACQISFNSDGQSINSCGAGKSLQNTSRAQSYLHIKNFSKKDVGIYICESPYSRGNDNYRIHVSANVPPTIKSWLEYEDNKMVAVCIAEGGNPKSNISWSNGRNGSVETLPGSDGFFTVKSVLEIPEGTNRENLSCVVQYPYWKHPETVIPELREDNFLWVWVVVIVAAVVFIAGILFFAQKKLTKLRQCKRSESSLSKPPRMEDVEEVEPYASYIQRVNSIYN
ncbi:cell surface glycoprotein CD200 receptor 1-A isoform 2-T2 [Pholidichthys leucotaenia]